MSKPVVAAVNLNSRTFLLDTQESGRITDMLDIEGQETDDPSEAVAAVGQHGNDWYAIDLSRFERARTQ